MVEDALHFVLHFLCMGFMVHMKRHLIALEAANLFKSRHFVPIKSLAMYESINWPYSLSVDCTNIFNFSMMGPCEDLQHSVILKPSFVTWYCNTIFESLQTRYMLQSFYNIQKTHLIFLFT